MKKSASLAAVVLLAPFLAACTATTEPASSATPTASSETAAFVIDPATPLEVQMDEAIAADDIAAVEALLDAGFGAAGDIRDGLNALHLVGYAGAEDLVPVFVEAGTPLEDSVNGMTPLLVAVSFGDAETVTAFLEAGSDVTARNPVVFNARPLHLAARWGNVDAIEALLDWGIDIDTLDDANGTPLIYAAYFGQYDAAVYLAEHGANLNQMDDFGDTPVVASTRMGFPEIADAMRALGAEG